MLKTIESYFRGEKVLVLLVDKISKKKDKKNSKKKSNLRLASSRRRRRKSLLRVPIISVAKKGTRRETARTIL